MKYETIIYVYNKTKETHEGPNNYYIGRPSILGNPYTHIKEKGTLARYIVKDRDTSIDMYSEYFDTMYGSDIEFTKLIDEIYDKYKSGIDVYLECYCKPLRCHGDIIVEKLQRRLVKEKLKEAKYR